MKTAYHDEFLPVVDSTNRRARLLADQGAPHGSGVRADRQTAGRGRLSRTWYSPAGRNLYCSYILRPRLSPAAYPRLTMVAGLAAAELLQRCSPGVRVGLKWPNDLMIGGKKCGGILCESSVDHTDDSHSFAIVGIGINLNLTSEELPAALRSIATSLAIEGAPPVDAAVMFTALRDQLLADVAVFETEGFQEVLTRWRRFDVLAGKRATWVAQTGEVVAGVSLGPDEKGLLRIEDESGVIHTVVSGDISMAGKQGTNRGSAD
ncbi:MAG: biotin--[acetyl-CoA-carboxylase] ligase [Desulfobulbaceae bacterium]|nr:biotin--[acetyl-CoA-carboxylase] ligase [Desulfobulbaceae bacterium]